MVKICYIYLSDSGEASVYTEEYLVVNDPSSVKRSAFNTKNEVKILIHGWSQKMKSRDFPGPVKHGNYLN